MVFMIVSIILIFIIGTLSHFLDEISSHNKIVGLFSAVNDSTWKHIKIVLTPSLLLGLIDGFLYGVNPNYFFAKFSSHFIIIILMPVLFYGHKAIFKEDSFFVDSLIFYLVILLSQFLFYILLRIEEFPYIFKYLGCAGTVILFGGYMIHTLMPAKSFLFEDPINHKYGYKGHTETFHVQKKK